MNLRNLRRIHVNHSFYAAQVLDPQMLGMKTINFGSCTIDLSEHLPWLPKARKRMERRHAHKYSTQCTPEPEDIELMEAEPVLPPRHDEHDIEMGLVTAAKTVMKTRSVAHKWKRSIGVAAKHDVFEDTPAWLQNREEVNDELEDTMESGTPFDEWPLWARSKAQEHEQRQVGTVKGLLRVVEHGSTRAVPSLSVGTKQLQQGQTVEVRVYIIACAGLNALDSNGLSDPFLKVRGKISY